MQRLDELLELVKLPEMFKVRQLFDKKSIQSDEIPNKIYQMLSEKKFADKIKSGMRIAITAGSRGICNADIIIRTIADFVKNKKAEPFIVPAMGSHGGATAEGQRNILAQLQITEEFCGCPICSSMKTVNIGKTEDGMEAFIDKFAAEADGIIVFCRIKPHTAFRGKFESGVMKMLSVGLGKQKGADNCHKKGFERMAENISKLGTLILEKAPVLFAVCVIENAFDDTKKIVVLDKTEIECQEPKLLKEAFDEMPCIQFDSCDVLIVDEIGKNFSGEGMDPNITGTFITPFASGGISAQKVVVLGMSKQTHGNGFGIGSADCTTRKAVKDIDLETMYINGITSTVLLGAKLPCIFENDMQAIKAAIKTCVIEEGKDISIVRISNSLQLEYIILSKNYYERVKNDKKHFEIMFEPKKLLFDSEENLQF